MAQVFLRFAAASGRLSEFLGPGEDNMYLDADLDTITTEYDSHELLNSFTELPEKIQNAYSGFVEGMQTRVKEVIH